MHYSLGGRVLKFYNSAMYNWSQLRWQNAVDFLVLSLVIYWLLHWGKQTRALRFFVGIGALLLTGSLAYRLDLILTAWVLHVSALVAVGLLLLVYHAEIRHALAHLDLLNRWVRSGHAIKASDCATLAEAAFSLAATRLGALIVLTGQDSLDDLVNGGVPLGGMISREILESIFRKVSPVHDGAVIIDQGKISQVGAFLPLTNREDLPMKFGTRHRAAIGLAENSDACVIVVSEERGEVSLVKGSQFQKIENPLELARLIEQQGGFAPQRSKTKRDWALFHDWGLKSAALGIAALIWALVFATGASVRNFSVPVEFQHVPPGYEVSNPSASFVSVQLRAAPWLFSALDWQRLVITVDVQGIPQGHRKIQLNAKNLNLPPGILFDHALPDYLLFSLNRSLPDTAPADDSPK